MFTRALARVGCHFSFLTDCFQSKAFVNALIAQNSPATPVRDLQFSN